MHRSTRLIVIAVAAAAFVPAAHATTEPPLPWVNTDIGSIETYPANWPDIDVHPATLPVPAAQQKPSGAKQKGFWGTSSLPSRATLITENSPSQNRLARRAVQRKTQAAPTGRLASTLRTFPS